ncbi:MAG: murein L,D-transpeptidase catalytic domain family protein [Candidatus Berkiella sp.]
MTTMLNNNIIKQTKFYLRQAISIRLFICLLLSVMVAGFAKPNTNASSSTFLHYQESQALKSSQMQIKGINPKVLQLAQKAHQKARAMGYAKKSTMTIIDYSMPSTSRRMWVVDMNNHKVIYNTLVAHGSGSGDNHAKRFSDVPGSLQSSLGVFVTGKTYQGKHGLSLTLHGLENGINGNAERRKIVIHGANYVSDSAAKNLGRLGRSWGCPALDHRLSTPVINTIKDGSLVFAYYPDDKWLKRSKFL